MPPSVTPAAMFQRRGGTYLQRLTKLYSDTKQSYETAKVTAATANINDGPEAVELEKDFQLQKDRLLAWGVHWADVEAQYQGQGDVDIDKKIDQAGLGEVVASVMSEIKRLLDESGRLQHPERFDLSKSTRGLKNPPSPISHRKEWTMHEVKTSRALLDQLTTCIDVLYSLSESRDVPSVDEKGGKKGSKGERHSSPSSDSHQMSGHPLYVDFHNLAFETDTPSQSTEPPSYDASVAKPSTHGRTLAFYRPNNTVVLVDFLSSDFPPHLIGSSDDIFEIHELGEKLCKNQSLSWCGHLRLLGFTVDPIRECCGIVYALPEGHGQQQLRQQQTLSNLIAAGYNSESSQPALEDRFRLAYNLFLSVMGYVTSGECHQHVNSNNIMLINQENHDRTPHTKTNIRNPYLLQSCQDFASRSNSQEPFESMIYRHPAHNVEQQEEIPAYDIYSLGLVLLEIGLWIPLSKLWKPKYDRRIFMERVQRIYSQKLASKCGTKYMRLVQKCLNAPSELHGKRKLEDAGIQLLEVAKSLQQCCAIDEDGPPPAKDIEIFEIIVIEQMYSRDDTGDDSGPGLPPRKQFSGEESDLHKNVEQPKTDTDDSPQTVIRSEPVLKKWPDVDIPQHDLDQWNTMLMPRLSKILQDTFRDSIESCSVSLMMVGSTIEKARTTICIQCANTTKVRDILQKRFKPKKGWGVVILKGDVRRSGKRRKPKRALYGRTKQQGVTKLGSMKKSQEQIYQERPTCGASIGVFKDNEHLPPVSYGGTILVDGIPFGMTVHHMLDNPSDIEDEDDDDDDEPEGLAEKPTRSAAPRDRKLPSQFDSTSDLQFMNSEDDLRRFSDLEISDDESDYHDVDNNSESDSDASTIRPDYSILDEEGNEFWFLEDTPPDLDDDDDNDSDKLSSSSSSASDNEDDVASIGDRIGILPFAEDDLCVTQPALDDVDEDFFPSLEDRDDDHLASHAFGYVHASSGIRRVLRDEIKHEVDWALIRINEERLKVTNSINQNKSKNTRRPDKTATKLNTDSQPSLTAITPSMKLSGLRVSCRGRSSGLRQGRISQAMALVKFHGRRSFSSSWCVDGGFGVPGDSGAWVYDPVTGELCGHVLAWGDKSRTAYIAPMEVLFEDMKARLGVRSIELPASTLGLNSEERTGNTSVLKDAGDRIPAVGERVKDGDVESALRGLSLQENVRSDIRTPSTSNANDGEVRRKTPRVNVKRIPIAGTVS